MSTDYLTALTDYDLAALHQWANDRGDQAAAYADQAEEDRRHADERADEERDAALEHAGDARRHTARKAWYAELAYRVSAEIERRTPASVAEHVTVSADDLDHTKPNPIDRAQRRYEGIDAPAPGVDDRTDPLAHVRRGDPDPTNDTNIWCGSKDPLGGARVCHREAGHVGHHIAANGSRVVAVWRDDV